MMHTEKGKVTPFKKRSVKLAKESYAGTEKAVKPVAKDTNKTRRSVKKPTKGRM
jgi:hypothetical protein